MKKSEFAIERCKTMSTLQKMLGGKWKLEILYYIAFQDVHRFGELRRRIGEITESSLTKQLRELEADGFINRFDYKEVPPKVEYTLTDFGESFMSVLDYMKAWGDANLNK
ncbi:MAG: winged helix-turn-helix transcriptional regulator [Anaerostipes sp.]|nr:winged helix-turn-helix transcriptional regulator [Anaerostipes sp.]MDD3745671.1 winged helix-turn-helix transcriptional regulator [Anaerostipes sp.]